MILLEEYFSAVNDTDVELTIVRTIVKCVFTLFLIVPDVNKHKKFHNSDNASCIYFNNENQNE